MPITRCTFATNLCTFITVNILDCDYCSYSKIYGEGRRCKKQLCIGNSYDKYYHTTSIGTQQIDLSLKRDTCRYEVGTIGRLVAVMSEQPSEWMKSGEEKEPKRWIGRTWGEVKLPGFPVNELAWAGKDGRRKRKAFVSKLYWRSEQNRISCEWI